MSNPETEMTAVTLQLVQQRQQELADLIEQLKAQTEPTLIPLPALQIELQPGERYAGALLDEHGRIKHHLVLLPNKPEGRMSWVVARAWAQVVGGSLPDRQEMALLYSNCRVHLPPEWYWSSEGHTNAFYAWASDQPYGHKSAEGFAVAVRRLKPQPAATSDKLKKTADAAIAYLEAGDLSFEYRIDCAISVLKRALET